MKKILLIAAIAISGCAGQPRPAKEPAIINTATPVCDGKNQCESMWAHAQDAVTTVTGMRIRLLTDSRIETYAPVKYGLTGGVVSKYPVSDGKYEIRLSIECYRHTECSDLRAIETNLFNSLVGNRRM